MSRILAVVVTLGFTFSMFNPILAEEQHTKDSIEKVKNLVKEKKAILIDVREKKEWDAGRLKEARLIPLSVLKSETPADEIRKLVPKDLPKDTILYIHCASGFRCLDAAPLLRKLGYEVRALPVGYKDLLKAGFEQAPEEKRK